MRFIMAFGNVELMHKRSTEHLAHGKSKDEIIQIHRGRRIEERTNMVSI